MLGISILSSAIAVAVPRQHDNGLVILGADDRRPAHHRLNHRSNCMAMLVAGERRRIVKPVAA